jgi:hypothetical protein
MSVPAWKRLGLKVKAVVNNDPLALVAPRVGDAEVDEQQQKSKTKVKTKATIETKKRKVDGEDDYDAEKSAVISKKPPKRVKLPKGEKKKLLGEHYAIRDQLQYLRTFAQDRENWKFSKQKQNWVIKNIRQVPEDYEEDLIVYLKSVQGGSKERIVADMAAVVAEWNKMVADAEAQMEADLSKTEAEAEAETAGGKTDKDSNNAKDKDSKKKKKQKPQPVKKEQQHSPPDYDYAVRARTVHAALTDEKLRLASIDDEVDDEVKQNEPQERESTTVLKEEDAPTPVALENVVLTETTVDVNKEEESDSSSDIDSDSDSSSDSDSDSDSDDE